MENNYGQPQSVVVLGGSSDIARAMTKRLCAARAHTVVLCGRNQTLLDEAADEAKEYGASKTDTVLFDAEDVSDAARASPRPSRRSAEDVDLVVVAVGLLGDQFAQENDAAAGRQDGAGQLRVAGRGAGRGAPPLVTQGTGGSS